MRQALNTVIGDDDRDIESWQFIAHGRQLDWLTVMLQF